MQNNTVIFLNDLNVIKRGLLFPQRKFWNWLEMQQGTTRRVESLLDTSCWL